MGRGPQLEATALDKNLNWILTCVVDQKSKSLTFAFRLGLSDSGDTVIRPLGMGHCQRLDNRPDSA